MTGLSITNSIFASGPQPIATTGGGMDKNCSAMPQRKGVEGVFHDCFASYLFRDNVIIGGGSGWPKGQQNPGNAADVGFVNYKDGSAGDYHLSPTASSNIRGPTGKMLAPILTRSTGQRRACNDSTVSVGLNPAAASSQRHAFSGQWTELILFRPVEINALTMQERDQVEIERSAAEAAKTVLAPVEIERYLDHSSRYLLTDWNTLSTYSATCMGRTVILDFGCGSGENLIPLVKRGAEVIAIDISPDLIELGHSPAPGKLWIRDATLHVRSAYRNRSARQICGCGVFGRTPANLTLDLYRVLAEIRRDTASRRTIYPRFGNPSGFRASFRYVQASSFPPCFRRYFRLRNIRLTRDEVIHCVR